MEDKNIRSKIESYPEEAKTYANKILSLIYETAKQDGIDKIEESLKWGEPSFKTPFGSPVRMDWKTKTPENFYIFFNCNTALIETFREIYGSKLQFEGNRAIVLKLSEEIPKRILQHCISLAFRYHKIKKLPLLGA